MDDDDKDLQAQDGEGSLGELDAKAKAAKKRKLIMLLAIGAMLLGAGGSALSYLFMGGQEEQVVDPALVEPEPINVAFYDLPQISANLLTDGRVSRYIKITVSLELANQADLPRVQQLLPRLQDDYQTFLRQLRSEDLRGSAGMFRIKEGLLRRARQSAAPVPIRNVLIKDLVIQ